MFLVKFILSLPEPLRTVVLRTSFYFQVIAWQLLNKPTPPPKAVKVSTILKYAKSHKLKTLIETGTYLGETVAATKFYFQKIYSLELNKKLYSEAKKLFPGEKKIKIIKGDSSIVLPKLLKTIRQPQIFWLDAHYSKGVTSKGFKETPIVEELKTIFSSKIKRFVILIDDARNFIGKNDYPKITELKKLINKKLPQYRFQVRDDIVRIFPKAKEKTLTYRQN